jgi:hypothetical protein
MDLPEVYGDFIDYLKPGDGAWVERGLVDNAPEDAIKAYTDYLETEKENEKQGIN